MGDSSSQRWRGRRIHDSIWGEASAEEKREIREIMETVMTTAMSLSVPLLVDFEE